MATTKKPTTTKKPAAKKTAVVKAHRGMAHVPRGRRRPIGTPQPPRNPRRRPFTPIQQPIGTPSKQLTPEQRKRMIEGMQKTRRRYLSTTPAQRKRQRDANIRRQLERGTTSGGQRITPQMRKVLESNLRQPARDRGLNFGNTKALGLPDMNMPPRRRRRPTQPIQMPKNILDRFNQQMEAANKRMRANVSNRGRKPTQATQTPKVATPRKRPTGTPRGPLPQVTPRRRRFRFRGRR